jgi:hypothetical protein
VLLSPLHRGVTQTDPGCSNIADSDARYVVVNPINFVARCLDRRMRTSTGLLASLGMDDRGFKYADGFSKVLGTAIEHHVCSLAFR